MEASTTPPRQQQRGRRRAGKVGLVYVSDFAGGIRRRRCGRGFTYFSAAGRRITAARTRRRIDALAIPPAWRDVWICARPSGHIQATGRDERGRRQYIYHPRWRAISDATKYDRMHLFAKLLSRIRRRVRKDLDLPGLPKARVMAALVRLMDKAAIRVGNREYAATHGSRGATTLTADHVELSGCRVLLDFPGKSGTHNEIEFSDEKIARVIRRCQEIDGDVVYRRSLLEVDW